MATAQTLPNIPTNYPLDQYLNQQSSNVEWSQEVMQLRVTSAQLKAIKATPITIVPAPGAGQAYNVIALCLKINFLTAAYTLNAGTLKLFYGPVANGHALTADLSAILSAVANNVISNVPILLVATDTLANGLNQPLVLANDGAAEVTVGGGSLDVTVVFGRTTP